MARPFQVLSLLSRLGALTVSPSASVNLCRTTSRDASKAWMGQSHVSRGRVSNRASRYSEEMSDDELELDDVEDKLQALVDEGRRRKKTVKYHILRRKMTPSGAPQRKLTWDAIEQIRYLKQEQPDDWTVEQLAEGFSVAPDVVLRVLRSKFVPTPERKSTQDAKVMAEISQQVLPSGAGAGHARQNLPGSPTPPQLPPVGSESAVVPVSDKTLVARDEGAGSLAVLPFKLRPHFSKDSIVVQPAQEDSIASTHSTGEDQEDEDSWDGQVLTEEELEECMEMEKPSPVVQVGKDFFDAEGNFLYRL